MRTLHLLIIEDDDAHAEIIKRHLNRSEGIRVVLTREAKLGVGLSLLNTHKFDALLLDLRLPDSDIEETLPKTVKVSHEVPIIVLSSLEDRQSAIKAVQEGAEDYLCKANLTPELLIRTILSSIERKENEIKIRQQLQQNAFLYELSQYALSESHLERVKIRCRETLMNSLLVDFVEIIEHPLSRSSHHSSSLVNLEEVELKHLKESLEKRELRWGINVLLNDKQTQSYFGVIAVYSHKERSFKPEDITFVNSVANILTSLIVRKKLQDQLHQKILDLQEAHQKKDDFLATLSHELRTPLNIITGYLEILKDVDSSSEEFSRAIEGIENNLQMETKLIEDTLDLSHIITGKMRLNLTSFNLRDAIFGVIESIAPAATAKKISITTIISSAIKDFYGDQNRIQQIIWNLLSNAVKFTPASGSIEIRASFEGSFFHFSVKDTGYGIAPENIKYVFNRFWQEDSSISRSYMGLGLGLGIVKQIVELHGGTVSVESRGHNEGALFSFKIPVSPVSQDALPKMTFESKSKTSSPLLNQRVLIIDDSEDTVALLQRLLQKAGAKVTGCINPVEALQTAKGKDFDVIISDIGMPVLNGYDFMKSYREWEKEQHHPTTPAIALTAYASEEDARKAMDAGFQVHMTKPMNIKILEKEIETLIQDVR